MVANHAMLLPMKCTIEISTTLQDAGQRFVQAWQRAERGEGEPETTLSFESWDTLIRTLTPKRLDLLRHLHRHSAASIAELARAVGRDYKRVHEDVERLTAVGLVERDAAGLRAEYDRIETRIAM